VRPWGGTREADRPDADRPGTAPPPVDQAAADQAAADAAVEPAEPVRPAARAAAPWWPAARALPRSVARSVAGWPAAGRLAAVRRRLTPPGLRARVVVAFAVGALLVSAVLALTTFVLTRSYLVDQRERSLAQQGYADAALLRSRIAGAGSVGDELGDLTTATGATVVVRARDGRWYSTSLAVGAHDVPTALERLVASGTAGTQRTSGARHPKMVVGVPLVADDAEFFEVTDLSELQTSLTTLAAVLAGGAAVATLAGAAFGTWASRRTVRPLEDVAGAATRIAGGELSARLAPTDDPDLTGIVTSFNRMVDALGARIERDARFVADVSHELRSPLTGLVTSVEVVGAHGAELSSRGQQALGLVRTELARFRHALDDLLALARLDGGPRGELTEEVSLGVLTAEVLGVTGRSATVLEWDPAGGSQVKADKPALQRALTNLLDNADRHGGGVRCVQVAATEEWVLVHVDDAGPGVPEADRQRIFERFARGSRAARGSLPGAGLGLAIVAETAARHGGSASCSDGPAGARFTLALPRADR
jgi:signal transduction histidine kinase